MSRYTNVLLSVIALAMMSLPAHAGEHEVSLKPPAPKAETAEQAHRVGTLKRHFYQAAKQDNPRTGPSIDQRPYQQRLAEKLENRESPSIAQPSGHAKLKQQLKEVGPSVRKADHARMHELMRMSYSENVVKPTRRTHDHPWLK
ncbi:hypothetical protein [Ferrimonas marina]|uniref:LTXXQ motif family protein n=1 Tax=Ferrimonas marina TaxID=299255 RepID=A0A1M5TBJ8_9GAMM|nr:hypothetical protein [Ferrimonas marina]SHH47713.1 hypothetical protein SAMN02745129_2061 [Ferrimonas marina]